MRIFWDDSEKRLADDVRKGNHTAMKKLYDTWSGYLFALCRRYVPDRENAEDILQDGFVTLFEKVGTYSETGSFEGWARKIFVNTALMSLRKNDALKMSETVDAASNMESGQPSAVQSLGYKELMHLVMSLPAGYRTVFNMFVIEGFNHNDIAAALGISPATSRSQLNRARQMLQEMIKNE